MKKKISLLGLALILVLGFTGCSKSDTTEYDQTELELYADTIIQSFSAMEDENFDYFTEMSDLELDIYMLNTGIPVSGENFLSMIDAWKAGEDECGAFVGLEDYKMETTGDSATLTANADFEDRDGSIEFVFDEKGDMESMTVAARYSTGEILQKAALNTIICMGTVFVVLIFISFIISLLKWIPVLEKKLRKNPLEEAAADENAAALETAAVTDETDDTELAAVIAAAVAAAEGTSADSFVVRSIKRRRSNKWN